MARKFPKLPSIQNVVAGSTASLSVPLGVTYHCINLTYAGVNLSEMKNIEVKLNGKTIQEFADGQRLSDMNRHYGRHTEAGILSIWFERPELDNLMLRRATCIGTEGIGTFQITFDIDAGATAPVIEAFATVSPNRPLGVITKVKRWVVSNSVTGVKEVADLPRAGRIASIFIHKADVLDCEVSVNSHKVYELDKALGAKVQKDYGRVPDGAKYTALEFMLEGDPAQALVVEGAQDFRLRPNFETAGSADVVVEYLSPLAGL